MLKVCCLSFALWSNGYEMPDTLVMANVSDEEESRLNEKLEDTNINKICVNQRLVQDTYINKICVIQPR